jgi:hypothetical protein
MDKSRFEYDGEGHHHSFKETRTSLFCLFPAKKEAQRTPSVISDGDVLRRGDAQFIEPFGNQVMSQNRRMEERRAVLFRARAQLAKCSMDDGQIHCARRQGRFVVSITPINQISCAKGSAS